MKKIIFLVLMFISLNISAQSNMPTPNDPCNNGNGNKYGLDCPGAPIAGLVFMGLLALGGAGLVIYKYNCKKEN